MNKFEKASIRAFEEWHENEELKHDREFTYHQTLLVLDFFKKIGVHSKSVEITGYAELMTHKFSTESDEYYQLDKNEKACVENYERIKNEYEKFRYSEYPLKEELMEKLDTSKLISNDKLYENAIRYIDVIKTKYHSWIWNAIQHGIAIDEYQEPYVRSQQIEYLRHLGLTPTMTLDEIMSKSAINYKIIFYNYIKKREANL